MDLLVFLAENAEQTVSKQKIMDAVWSDTFVGDNVLWKGISELRQVLEEDPRSPELIQTVPKRGYRLTTPVVAVGEELVVRGSRHWKFAAILVPVVILVASAVWWNAGISGFVVDLPGISSGPADQEPTLAILPFSSTEVSLENQALSERLTEEILIGLVRLGNLHVIPPASVRPYRESGKDVLEIGQELGVTAVVDGSVRLKDDSVQVTARLTDVDSNRLLWVESYDREITGMFEIRSEVVLNVAGALEVEVSSKAKSLIERRATEHSEAYRLYAMGRHFQDQSTPEGIEKAISLFQQAVQLDPYYAEAFGALAHSYIDAFWVLPGPWRRRAEEAAQKALDLDESTAAAQWSMGIVQQLKGNPVEAERRFKRALELDPLDSEAHYQYGAFLWRNLGRFDGALPELLRAYELDPVSETSTTILAEFYLDQGNFNQSIHFAKELLELHPNSVWAHYLIGKAYSELLEFERAEPWLKRAFELAPQLYHVTETALLNYVYEGKNQQAMEIHRRWSSSPASGQRATKPLIGGELALRVGDYRKAQEYFEKITPAWREGYTLTCLGYLLLRMGEQTEGDSLLSEAFERLNRKLERGLQRGWTIYLLAAVQAVRGNTEEAYRWLQQMADEGYWLSYNYHLQHPLLESLQDDDRFQSMLSNVRSRIEAMQKQLEPMEPELKSLLATN
jgi:TolB-like protein/tetratricopeptide (TPR) repeat protein